MILSMLPLALGAAISPVFLAITVELLARGRPPRRWAAAAFLAGSAVPLVGLAAVGLALDPNVLGDEAASERFGIDLVDSVLRIDVIDAVLGVALLAIAVGIFRHWHRSTAGRRPARRSWPSRPGALVAFGAVMMTTNASTMLLVVGALRDVARYDPSLVDELVAVGLLVAITLVPVWAPLVVDVLAPTAMQRALTPITRLVYEDGPQIVAVVSAALGIYLVVRSLTAR